MRNLKRALSLTMASIMILGMMVIGAGAASLNDFSDKDKIVNTEAVTVLTTLNVIAGKDDGSFDPTGIVTRAEMAKMICVVLNGGKDPQLGNLTADYKDTKGHWAEAYIAYCTNLGIVAGTGGGNFEPNATVTASQAAKMLLVALGYNADVEKYVGASWQINVDVAANQNKLYDKLGVINTSNGLSRDNAAQMVYNTLSADLVEYNYVITGNSDNSLTTKPQITSKDLGTLLEKKFGAVRVEGIVVANEVANLKSTTINKDKDTNGGIIGSALDAERSSVTITNTDAQKEYSGIETFAISSDMSVLGRSVFFFVKPSTNALKSTVIGGLMLSDDNKEVKDYSADKINTVADDNNLNIVSTTQVVKNYAGQAALTSAEAAIAGAPGVEKILIDNDSDNNVDYVLLNTVELGKVTKHTTNEDGAITVSRASGKGSFAVDNKKNAVGFEDVANGDAVLTSFIGGKLYVEKAEVLTGTVEAYKLKTLTATDYVGTVAGTYTGNLTVDGTNYTVSFAPTYTDSADFFAAKDPADKGIIDSKASFYLDNQGYIIARTEVDEAAYQYAYVWGAEAGGSIATDRVKVTLDDGTTKTYDLDSKSDIDVVTAATNNATHTINQNDMQGLIFAYTLGKSGDIKLMLPKGGAVDGTLPDHAKGMTSVKITGSTDVAELLPATVNPDNSTNTYFANNSSVFFYITTKNGNVDKVNVYRGRANAPSVDGKATGSTALLALNSKGDIGAVAMTDTSAKEEAGDHLFVYANKYVYSDYVQVGAILNGEIVGKDINVSKYLDADVNNNTVVADGLYLYTIDGDGNYELEAANSNTFFKTGTVSRVPIKNTIVIGTDEYLITNKSVIIDNTSNPNPADGIMGGAMNKDDSASMLVNSDDEILMAFYVTPSTTSGGGNNATYAPKLAVSGSLLNVKFYVGDGQPTNSDLVSLIKGQISNVATVVFTDQTHVTVTYTNGASDFLEVKSKPLAKVSYNGTTQFLEKDETLSVSDAKILQTTTPSTGVTTYVDADNANTAFSGGVGTMKYAIISTINDTTTDAVLVDGYAYSATGTDANNTVALPSGVNPATIAAVTYIPANTTLTLKVNTGNTATVKDSSGAVLTTFVNSDASAKTFTYKMPTKAVAISFATTPANATLEFEKAAGMAGQAAYANGVYTARNGDKFSIVASKTAGVAGDVVSITVTPQDFTSENNKVLTFKVGATTVKTLTWAANSKAEFGFTYTLTSGVAGVNTLTIEDDTTAAYTLTLPAGVTASGTGVTDKGNGVYLVAGTPTITLAGSSIVATSYLKANTTYVKDGSNTFSMPASNLVITADKYYKVIAGTGTSTATDSSATTTTTVTLQVNGAANDYVKATDTVTVNATLGTLALAANKGGAKANVTVNGGSSAVIAAQSPLATVKLFDASAAVGATGDISIIFTSFAASDVTLDVALSDVTP